MVLCWIYAVLGVLGVTTVISLWQAGRHAGGPPDLFLTTRVDVTPTTFVVSIPIIAFSIATAFGLAKDLPWSRPLMMLLLILGVVTLPLTPELASTQVYVISIALLVFGYWYLYHKPNVVAYYDAIRSRS